MPENGACGRFRSRIRLHMKPVGMTRGFFSLAPFLKHQRRDAFQLGMLFRRADVAGKLQSVAIGVKEIDRP